MGISELNELRVLRDENQRLKRLVADLTLDKHILQEVGAKKSEASTSPGGRAVDLRDLCGDDFAIVQADPIAALGVLLQRPPAGLYGPSATIARVGRNQGALRLSVADGAVAATRDHERSQRGLSDLPRGKPGGETTEAAETCCAGAQGASTGAARERPLVDGLCDRPTGERPGIPDFDVGGSIHKRVSDPRARSQSDRQRGRGLSAKSGNRAVIAGLDHRRQWRRVCRSSAGYPGLSQQGEARLHPSRESRVERLHRKLQRKTQPDSFR